MKTFIKWAGGKEKELNVILKNKPKMFNRYIEPFVGGGAVYLNIQNSNSLINDKSDELMLLYKMIKNNNRKFFNSLGDINKNWLGIENFVLKNGKELEKIYTEYKNDNEKLNSLCDSFINKNMSDLKSILENEIDINLYTFIKEVEKNLKSKISRMYKIEQQRGEMPEEDVLSNIECAFKSAYYMYFRYLYNNKEKLKLCDEFYCAIFYFVREYCYASMFRYNANGEFNVPYGGISYNRKDFKKKIDYLKSKELIEYMKNTTLYNLDFEEFCSNVELNEDDFMFLDPPYDTEFSTYAKNEFNKNDQVRLAEFLKNTKAKFMLIIKNTDFIYKLYNDKHFYISSFNKKYLVSIMNRNDKKVEHLIITNYSLEDSNG